MSLRIVSGKYRGRTLQTPKGANTRPTQESVREALFNICQGFIEGETVLDLFGGSGAIGFEALSRGAAHVTFVEKDPPAISAIKKNIDLLGVHPQTLLIPGDAFFVMKRLKSVDFIYLDPPYEMDVAPIVNAILRNHLLNAKGTLFIEEIFSPKKPPLPFASLLLNRSKRFGKTSLLQYSLGKDHPLKEGALSPLLSDPEQT